MKRLLLLIPMLLLLVSLVMFAPAPVGPSDAHAAVTVSCTPDPFVWTECFDVVVSDTEPDNATGWFIRTIKMHPSGGGAITDVTDKFTQTSNPNGSIKLCPKDGSWTGGIPGGGTLFQVQIQYPGQQLPGESGPQPMYANGSTKVL